MEELKSVVSCLSTPQPVSPDLRAQNMKLKLQSNITYVVCGIIIEGDKVLLIQEAMPSCRGKWYLPAGLVEKNETLVEAAKREVQEESGVDFEPEALIAVECNSYRWVRFTFTGSIVGGSLKTPAQADEESIQGGWFPANTRRLQREVELRGDDFLPLVELAAKWYRQPHGPFSGLPVQVGHTSSSLRLVIMHEDSSRVDVLMRESPSGSTSLPVFLLSRDHHIVSSVHKTLKACGYTGGVEIAGVLQMEHLGNPSGVYDGICLSVVARAKSRELGGGANWQWAAVEDQACAERLRTAVRSDFGCAKLVDCIY